MDCLKKFAAVFAAAAFAFAGPAALPGSCDPGDALHAPAKLPMPKRTPLGQQDDILLIMPAGDADKDEVNEAIKKVNGTVVGTIGDGPMTVLKVKVERAKFLESEKKLSQDKNFASVQRNFVYHVNVVSSAPVNDPFFANEWHLGALNVPRAWQISKGGGNVIAVLDTGVNSSVSDLKGKTYSGYDAIAGREGQTDVYGHGTMVSTTAAALTNNGTETAAPARMSYIYPIRVGTAQGTVDEAAILQGIYRAGSLGIKMINISANASPPYSFANKTFHPALHTYMRWYHDSKGGLIFNSAGNDGQYDQSPRVPYLIVCSALDTDYSLADFSTYGNPVWFTAPGVSIYCTTRDNKVASVAGTSFSAPLTASIAALIWGANPKLRNTDVERILVQTCYTVPGQSWTPWYGYGLPNAEAAMKAATGR